MLTYIHKLIDQNHGSISISDFMSAALYHEKYGYYMKQIPFGGKGDFITSPEISQLFGEMLAVWIMCTWERLGKPEKFSLVELGPGNGTLMRDIVITTKKCISFFKSMLVHLVEISPILCNVQKQTLKGLKIEWHKDIDNLPNLPTIFLANEFFDSLPIDQFVYYDKKWYENRISRCDDNGLKISQIETSNFSNNFVVFDGAIAEVCLPGIKMIKKIEEKICKNRGAALIIDYGYIYPIYKNTLQSIKCHHYTHFLKNIGDNDITSLVNFHALKNSLKHLNCEIYTQRELLYSLGIKERTQILIKNRSCVQEKKIIDEFLRLTENMGTIFKAMLI